MVSIDIGSILLVILIPALLLGLVSYAIKWRLYEKMGFYGWKSLIPVYSSFLLYKAVFGTGWVFLVNLLPAVAMIPALIFSFIAALMRLPEIGIVLNVLLYLGVFFIVVFVHIKLRFGLARVFNQSKAFGFGLWLMAGVFEFILAFSADVYKDGSYAVSGNDVISSIIRRFDAWVRGVKKVKGDSKSAITLLKELSDLHKDGIIDDETFESKKQELLKRI